MSLGNHNSNYATDSYSGTGGNGGGITANPSPRIDAAFWDLLQIHFKCPQVGTPEQLLRSGMNNNHKSYVVKDLGGGLIEVTISKYYIDQLHDVRRGLQKHETIVAPADILALIGFTHDPRTYPFGYVLPQARRDEITNWLSRAWGWLGVVDSNCHLTILGHSIIKAGIDKSLMSVSLPASNQERLLHDIVASKIAYSDWAALLTKMEPDHRLYWGNILKASPCTSKSDRSEVVHIKREIS